jgi:hypothetical protein
MCDDFVATLPSEHLTVGAAVELLAHTLQIRIVQYIGGDVNIEFLSTVAVIAPDPAASRPSALTYSSRSRRSAPD